MWLELEIALRFLRRRTGILLRGTALAALGGITLATAALVITLALMNGYREAISQALRTGNAHVVGFAPRPLSRTDASAMAEALAALPGVRGSTPVSYLTGLADDPQEPANPLPVVLKAVSSPPVFTGLDAWPQPSRMVAVVGSGLAASLGLEPGSVATVRLPPRRGAWSLPALGIEVIGTFHLSFAEFDDRWLVVPLDALAEALPDIGVAGVEIELDDPLQVDVLRPRLEDAAPDLMMTDWKDLNGALFAALTWQTRSLFVVLSLVVAVASFQLSSALVVLAIDKRRSTGMLQALGASPARIMRILVLAGCLLGGVGVSLGMAVGMVSSLLMTHLRVIRFPADLAKVYMVDHIPFLVTTPSFLAVTGVCLVLVLGASLWPAWQSSRLDPVAALKAV